MLRSYGEHIDSLVHSFYRCFENVYFVYFFGVDFGYSPSDSLIFDNSTKRISTTFGKLLTVVQSRAIEVGR